jgi:hypothetical protein
VHPYGRHRAAECREIIDLAKRVSERREQSSKDGSPPRRRPSKEKEDDGEVATAERDLGCQSPEGDLKDIFTGGSYSGEDNYTNPRGTLCPSVYGAGARLSSGGPSGPPGSRLQTGICRSDHCQRQGLPRRIQMGTLGWGLAPRQIPHQEGSRNSPPAEKDPSR